MPRPGDDATRLRPDAAVGPTLPLAVLLILGLSLGRWWPGLGTWIAVLGGIAAVGLLGAWVCRRRGGWGAISCVRGSVIAVILVALAAGYGVLRLHYLPGDTVARYVQAEPQLARVAGTVVEAGRLVDPARGAFGGFSYGAPATLFVIETQRIQVADQWRAASGRLLVAVDGADPRLVPGTQLEAMGWLGALAGPMNPGERDAAADAADEGIYGRLSLATRENLSILRTPPLTARGFRHTVAARARAALHEGFPAVAPSDERQRERVALLEALLLGVQAGGRWMRSVRASDELGCRTC